MLFKTVRHQDRQFLDQIKKLPCIVCGKPGPSDPSHIKTIGSGGPDNYLNVVPKCRKCHDLWGKGAITFLKKYPRFRNHLFSLGWEIVGNKLVNPQLHLWEPRDEILEAVF